MFYVPAVLFREKKFYSALQYSHSLTKNKKAEILTSFIQLYLKLFIYWLIPLLLMLFISTLFQNNIFFFFIYLISTILINILNFYQIIFFLQYFLNLEKRRKIEI